MVVASPTPAGDLEDLAAGDLAALVADARRRRTAGTPFEVAVIIQGPAALELGVAYRASATWLLATGWLDTLGELIDRGPR